MGLIGGIWKGMRIVYHWFNRRHIRKKKKQGLNELEKAIRLMEYQYDRIGAGEFIEESIQWHYRNITRILAKYAKYSGYEGAGRYLKEQVDPEPTISELMDKFLYNKVKKPKRTLYNYFHMLNLPGQETDKDYIDLAYRKAKYGQFQDSRMVFLLDDAYETLSDTQRRASYKAHYAMPYLEDTHRVLRWISPELAKRMRFETRWKIDSLERTVHASLAT